MDFSTLDLSAKAAEGADMQVRHPVTQELLITGGEPVTIRLRGHDCPEFRAFAADMNRRAVRSRGVAVSEAEARSVDLLYKLTMTWSGVEWEGAPLPFNETNAKMLYRNLAWLREQIDEFVTDRANFA